MKKKNEITAANAQSFTARQIIETLILNPRAFVYDRQQKYFLGDVVASKCLHCQISSNSKK